MPTWAHHVGVGANINVRVLKFDDRARVDHDGRPFWNIHRAPIDQRRPGITDADQVRDRIRLSGQIAVGAAIPHDPHDVRCGEQTVRVLHVERDEIGWVHIHMVASGDRRRLDVAQQLLIADRGRNLGGHNSRTVTRINADRDVSRINTTTDIRAIKFKHKRRQVILDGEKLRIQDSRRTIDRRDNARSGLG